MSRSSTTRRIMSLDLSIGTRLPAYCTSMGRVLPAHLPKAAIDGYFARVKRVAFTNRAVIAPDRLRREFKTIRSNDYAIVDQELELGLRSIAVPVRDMTGRVVGAMDIGTQASRIPLADRERRLLPQLQHGSRELSASVLT